MTALVAIMNGTKAPPHRVNGRGHDPRRVSSMSARKGNVPSVCCPKCEHRFSLTLELRFWGKVNREGSCWEWEGAKGSGGYGYFTVARGCNAMAHRMAYELLVGPIPRGLHIDHLCRNRACVNPEHLEPVTPRENSSRGLVGGQTHCKRGHEFTFANTRIRPNGTRQCRACAAARERRRRAR